MKAALLKSALVVGMGTTASRTLGFAREVLMAYFFGTELAKSAFDIAFKIPNLFRTLFGEGALSAAFVPVFTKTHESEGLEAASSLAGRIAGLLSVVLGGIVLAGVAILFVLPLVSESGPKATEVLVLLRIMLPYTLFICLAALCMGILNALNHYAVPALTPVILNVIWILGLFFVCPLFGETSTERIRGLAWCILFAGLIQLLVQVPVLRAKHVHIRFSIAWRDPKVKRILLLMGPAALGMGIHQVNAVIDSFLAIIVGDWAPAALTYAERLIYLPLGMVATAFGTVLLPTYSRQVTQGEGRDMSATLDFAFRSVLLIMAPAAVGLCVLAEPITVLVYSWKGGVFDSNSIQYTSRALAFYAPGLVVFSIYKVVVPAFYALQDTRTPVRVGVWTVVLNFALNLLFIFTWPEGYKHAGLACATVIASLCNGLLLAVILSRRLERFPWASMGLGLLRIGVVSGVVGWVASETHLRCAALGSLKGLEGKWLHIFSTGSAIVLALVAFLVLALVVSRQELMRLLKRRRGKNS